MERPALIVGSPGKFDVYTKAIINKKIMDPYTIRFTTKEPYPLMLADLTSDLHRVEKSHHRHQQR